MCGDALLTDVLLRMTLLLLLAGTLVLLTAVFMFLVTLLLLLTAELLLLTAELLLLTAELLMRVEDVLCIFVLRTSEDGFTEVARSAVPKLTAEAPPCIFRSVVRDVPNEPPVLLPEPLAVPLDGRVVVPVVRLPLNEPPVLLLPMLGREELLLRSLLLTVTRVELLKLLPLLWRVSPLSQRSRRP